jgi:outer membrane protein insertion porin family/translocation and assembly module TamA
LRLGSIWGGAEVGGARQPPQSERLYAGGASSVRGYQQNELGSLLYVFDDTSANQIQIRSVPASSPGAADSARYFVLRGDSAKQRRVVPVGGNRLFVANVDYRVRSPILPQLLQFTFFTDVGTVWNWNTQQKFGGFDLRFTPGVGVRVFSPLGPIQVNAGYNPKDPVFGQALFTPNRTLASSGYTGVYCAVKEGTPLSKTPLSHIVTANGKSSWQQDPNAVCSANYQQTPPKSWTGRLTFTFSIGPEF